MELPKVKKKMSDVSKRIEANKDIDFASRCLGIVYVKIII